MTNTIQTSRSCVFQHSQSPIGKPRYLKGRKPFLQFNKQVASNDQDLLIFTPTKRPLLKLTFKLEANSNNRKFSLIALMLTHIFSPTVRVSFANFKWDSCRSERTPTFYPKGHYSPPKHLKQC